MLRLQTPNVEMANRNVEVSSSIFLVEFLLPGLQRGRRGSEGEEDSVRWIQGLLMFCTNLNGRWIGSLENLEGDKLLDSARMESKVAAAQRVL